MGTMRGGELRGVRAPLRTSLLLPSKLCCTLKSFVCDEKEKKKSIAAPVSVSHRDARHPMGEIRTCLIHGHRDLKISIHVNDIKMHFTVFTKRKREMEFTKSERVVRNGAKDEGKPHYSTQRNPPPHHHHRKTLDPGSGAPEKKRKPPRTDAAKIKQPACKRSRDVKERHSVRRTWTGRRAAMGGGGELKPKRAAAEGGAARVRSKRSTVLKNLKSTFGAQVEETLLTGSAYLHSCY